MNRSIILAAIIIGAAILLNGQFERISRSHRDAASADKARAANGGKGVAVLPFQNLSGDPQNSHFADGVREELVAQLAKLPELKVVDLDTQKQRQGADTDCREFGHELGVAYLVRGSIQRAANRVKLQARLIRAGDNQTVWTETYDRELSDVFALEAEIAQKIAEQLRSKLSSGAPHATNLLPIRSNHAVQLTPGRRTA